MNDSDIKSYFNNRLVIKELNATVDPLLLPATLDFLRTVGLPNDKELNFVFDAHMILLNNGLVQLHGPGIARPVYLAPQQGDALFYSNDDESFINSGVREFTQCIYEFEQYYCNEFNRELFSNQNNGNIGSQNRRKFATHLEGKIRTIDPIVFERGYYWPAFIEDIENRLL